MHWPGNVDPHFPTFLEITLFATTVWKQEINKKVFQVDKTKLEVDNKNTRFLSLQCLSC